MENLATIQKVKNVRPCPNSDNLDLIQVLGWQVVTKRGEFKDGDLCVYIAIDTVLPDTNPEFEFLRNKNFRIKPIRLRGEESAGICFPLSILPKFQSIGEMVGVMTYGYDDGKRDTQNVLKFAQIGDDVTNVLGIKHYEKPVPSELAGKAFGGLPGFIIMTDEDNLRSYPDAVPEMYGRPYYITRKDDGCSGYFFLHDGIFGVCSRKIHLMESEGNGFWRMARKYKIEEALRSSGTDIAIQGEVCGPGIQDNHLGLTELELHVFNLFNIVTRTYLPYEKLVEFCKVFAMPMVTVIEESVAFGYTLEELIAMATKQKYPNGTPAEGIVIRPKESYCNQTS